MIGFLRGRLFWARFGFRNVRGWGVTKALSSSLLAVLRGWRRELAEKKQKQKGKGEEKSLGVSAVLQDEGGSLRSHRRKIPAVGLRLAGIGVLLPSWHVSAESSPRLWQADSLCSSSSARAWDRCNTGENKNTKPHKWSREETQRSITSIAQPLPTPELPS